MPLYLYQNPKTKEVKEVLQGMNDEHVYEEKGVKWDRIYTVPQGNVPLNIDPNNPKDFVHKTRHKGGSIGNLMDMSQEAAEKRQKRGPDKIQNGFFDDWSKTRHGKKHPNDTR